MSTIFGAAATASSSPDSGRGTFLNKWMYWLRSRAGHTGFAQVEGDGVRADAVAGGRVNEQRRIISGRERQVGAALPQPVQLLRRRSGAQGQVHQFGERGPLGHEGAADHVGAGHDRLAEELGAQVPKLCHRLAVEGLNETGLGGHTRVDGVRREMVLEDHLGRTHSRHRVDRVEGVGDHQEREVGRAEVRGQPQPDRRPPVARDGAAGDEAQAGHGLVEFWITLARSVTVTLMNQ